MSDDKEEGMSDDNDKPLADLIKVPFRGAAPAQAATLIGTTTPPPPGTWVLELPFDDSDVIPDPDDDFTQEGIED